MLQYNRKNRAYTLSIFFNIQLTRINVFSDNLPVHIKQKIPVFFLIFAPMMAQETKIRLIYFILFGISLFSRSAEMSQMAAESDMALPRCRWRN
jgi:hypothetical protein